VWLYKVAFFNFLKQEGLIEIINNSNEADINIYSDHYNKIDISKFMVNFTNSKIIIVAEEHIPRGGLFAQLLTEFYRNNLPTKNITHFSLPEKFSHNYGSQIDHFMLNSLTGQTMADYVKNTLPTR
jgi:transketolase C-terminal domain/subunit